MTIIMKQSVTIRSTLTKMFKYPFYAKSWETLVTFTSIWHFLNFDHTHYVDSISQLCIHVCACVHVCVCVYACVHVCMCVAQQME